MVGVAPAGYLEGGQQPPNVPHVILDQFHGTVEFGPVLDSHHAIQVSGDDVVVTDFLLSRMQIYDERNYLQALLVNL